MPLPGSKGEAAEFTCGCLWKLAGMKRINTYEKDEIYEAKFKCGGRCNASETKYWIRSMKYEEEENVPCIFTYQTKTTFGFYNPDGTCGCNDPNGEP